jgi:sugar phosphate isomerase/epimerase
VQFGCCIPAAYASVAARMGYDYVEIPTADLRPEAPPADFRETERAIAESGIPARAFNYLVPADLPVVGHHVDLARLRRYLASVAERAAALGGQTLVFGSGPARRVPDLFPRSRAAEQFRTAASIAGEAAGRHGLHVAIEAINRTETNYLHALADAVEQARSIGSPSVGVLADAYHMHMEAEPFWHLLETAGLLRHVQVCDEGRSWPGSRGMGLWGFFAYLNQLPYDGTVSVECRWNSFTAEGSPALEFVRRASATSGLLAFAP